jgi:hypothetical protein
MGCALVQVLCAQIQGQALTQTHNFCFSRKCRKSVTKVLNFEQHKVYSLQVYYVPG